MQLCTTSETISFGRMLEESSALFYQDLLQKYPEAKALAAFPEENRKFVIQIQRAYQSVITDAIEGCYAFQLESDLYGIDTTLSASASWTEAVQKALAIEETILNFYHTAADQSMALMADIPRNFKLVAKKKAARVVNLKALV
ncbi:MAG: hypothetical protein V2B13_04730 [Pseudomonadota bacterium]